MHILEAFVSVRVPILFLYMQLGKSLARVDEAGVELCLELNTPTYGEEPAGDDCGATCDNDIRATGWQPAKAVEPVLYTTILCLAEHMPSSSA